MPIIIAIFIAAAALMHHLFPQPESCASYPHAYCLAYKLDSNLSKRNDIQLEITEVGVHGQKMTHHIPFVESFIWYHKWHSNKTEPVIYFKGNITQKGKLIPSCSFEADAQELSLRKHYDITLYYDKSVNLLQCKKVFIASYN